MISEIIDLNQKCNRITHSFMYMVHTGLNSMQTKQNSEFTQCNVCEHD